ncbi:hypothetical protein GN244_ATG12003 [Phytophthora infestans]|uniref:Uncharacterized protein n=1 Tax=Phytophthora infestans TaxID=4787 RepID=A0A833VZX4_PHYIN|nr:hypothetical protein GN244_ATG12003 [Phytophthora infestans]KAF4138075.1 hypothetical protein GN958_ATG12684 [Phytophthora infestans]
MIDEFAQPAWVLAAVISAKWGRESWAQTLGLHQLRVNRSIPVLVIKLPWALEEYEVATQGI